MFNLKFIFSVSVFIIFLIFTSIIKNQSRILEKKILGLNNKILSYEKNLSELQLEFFYLSSPLEIEKKFIKKDLKEFQPIDYSKIFYDLRDLINIEKKLSNLIYNYEKKN